MPATASGSRSRSVTYGAFGGVIAVMAAAFIGSRPMGDNSFLTHLATGRLILDEGRVPVADPYSFTASGEPWVVQSWLASVIYGVSERVAGGLGLQLVYLALCAGIGALVWWLTAPADGLIARLFLWGLVLAVGTHYWVERPLLFGLVFFATTLLACDRALPGPLLLLMGWSWVNIHGSFPLGIVAVVLLAAGRRIDGDRPTLELQTMKWLGGGMLLGALNPVGPRLLLFPLNLLRQQDVLTHVVEWRAPTFESAGERAFVVLLLVAVAGLVRQKTWRYVPISLVFTAAALVAARNIPIASLVFVGAVAPAFGGLGAIRSSAALRGGGLLVGVTCLLGGLVVLGRAKDDNFDLVNRYPLTALAVLEQRSVDLTEHRLAAPDVVGNLVTSLGPPAETVYFDDRFDMYPEVAASGFLTLHSGRPGWRAELDRVNAELVIWNEGSAMAQLLASDSDWRMIYTDESWSAFCRRGRAVGDLRC